MQTSRNPAKSRPLSANVKRLMRLARASPQNSQVIKVARQFTGRDLAYCHKQGNLFMEAASIEFNHSGIPDDELKPEEFNDYQLAVLKALPPERQAPIRRGCPVSVIDLATGNQIAAFNMHNVAPSELQKKQLGKAVYEAMQRYFQDPENVKKYEAWKKKKEAESDGGDKT